MLRVTEASDLGTTIIPPGILEILRQTTMQAPQGSTQVGATEFKVLVRDGSLRPLPGASVLLMIQQFGIPPFKILDSAVTDSNGIARLKDTPPIGVSRKWIIRAQKNGFQPKAITGVPVGTNTIDLLPAALPSVSFPVRIEPAIPNVLVVLKEKTTGQERDRRRTDRSGRVVFGNLHPRVDYFAEILAGGYDTAIVRFSQSGRDHVVKLKRSASLAQYTMRATDSETGQVVRSLQVTFLKDDPVSGTTRIVSRGVTGLAGQVTFTAPPGNYRYQIPAQGPFRAIIARAEADAISRISMIHKTPGKKDEQPILLSPETEKKKGFPTGLVVAGSAAAALLLFLALSK